MTTYQLDCMPNIEKKNLECKQQHLEMLLKIGLLAPKTSKNVKNFNRRQRKKRSSLSSKICWHNDVCPSILRNLRRRPQKSLNEPHLCTHTMTCLHSKEKNLYASPCDNQFNNKSENYSTVFSSAVCSVCTAARTQASRAQGKARVPHCCKECGKILRNRFSAEYHVKTQHSHGQNSTVEVLAVTNADQWEKCNLKRAAWLLLHCATRHREHVEKALVKLEQENEVNGQCRNKWLQRLTLLEKSREVLREFIAGLNTPNGNELSTSNYAITNADNYLSKIVHKVSIESVKRNVANELKIQFLLERLQKTTDKLTKRRYIPIKGRFTCTECGKVYASPTCFKRHVDKRACTKTNELSLTANLSTGAQRPNMQK